MSIKKSFLDPRRLILYFIRKTQIQFLQDRIFVKMLYKYRMKKKLNLDNPSTFNEKLQWLKIYDRNPKYKLMVDKFEVRKIIANSLGEEYLIPLVGVWNKFEDINFEELPDRFVLKTTHDSGSVIICTNKNNFDYRRAKRKLNKSLKSNYYYRGAEWPYKFIKPRIICEKYMVDESGYELKDYKFMCFNGEPKIIQVMSGREKGRYFLNHFDLDWNEIYIPRKNLKKRFPSPLKPKNLDKMIEFSKILSKDIPFVRIDLYETENGVYFGEITFFPVGGYMDFEEEKHDYLLGSWIRLPINNDFV